MNKYLKLIVLIVPLSGAFVLGFNNCGRYGQMDGETDSSSLASTSSVDNVQDSQALGVPYALLSAEQTLSSMMKVTNTAAVPAAVKTEYDSRYGSLAAGNDLNMANGPLMLGSTSLAGSICGELVKNEAAMAAASRNFFGSINFATGGVSGIDDTSYATAIRGMARSYWGRAENASEYAMLFAFKKEFSDALAANARTTAVSANNLMIGTCAAMLSSVDAITY